jgi:hypothetical protein
MKKARGGWVTSGLFFCCNLLFRDVELSGRAANRRCSRAKIQRPIGR